MEYQWGRGKWCQGAAGAVTVIMLEPRAHKNEKQESEEK